MIMDMGYQGWDPGKMYTIKEGPTVKEMYRSEGLHRVYNFEGMIWVYVITGIVTEWDNGQQCYERVMMGGLFKVDEVPGIRHMSMDYVGVWDTGQQAHMEQPARVEQDTVDQSASFGWCTNVQGTDAEDDATSLWDYTSLGMMGQARQCLQQLHAGQHRCQQQAGGAHHQEHEGRDHESRGHHQPQDGQHPLLRPAGQQPEKSHLQQLSGQGYRQLQVGQHLLLQQAGRPPEADHHDDGDDKYDNFGLDISCRNKYEQMSSVLEGGGASLVVQSRVHGKPNIVCCRVSVRFPTWAEVHASTDTLVCQPPYLVTRGWEEVVPWGD
jgi:hypothetical protein